MNREPFSRTVSAALSLSVLYYLSLCTSADKVQECGTELQALRGGQRFASRCGRQYHWFRVAVQSPPYQSQLNVSLIVRDKVTRPCPQTTTFEEKGEPKRYRTEVLPAYQPTALPLGQTGSLDFLQSYFIGLTENAYYFNGMWRLKRVWSVLKSQTGVLGNET